MFLIKKSEKDDMDTLLDKLLDVNTLKSLFESQISKILLSDIESDNPTELNPAQQEKLSEKN